MFIFSVLNRNWLFELHSLYCSIGSKLWYCLCWVFLTEICCGTMWNCRPYIYSDRELKRHIYNMAMYFWADLGGSHSEIDELLVFSNFVNLQTLSICVLCTYLRRRMCTLPSKSHIRIAAQLSLTGQGLTRHAKKNYIKII